MKKVDLQELLMLIEDRISYLESDSGDIKSVLKKLLKQVTEMAFILKEIDEVSLQYVENPTIEVEIDNKQTLINQLLSIPSNKDKMKELEEELKKLKDELTFNIVGEA